MQQFGLVLKMGGASGSSSSFPLEGADWLQAMLKSDEKTDVGVSD